MIRAAAAFVLLLFLTSASALGQGYCLPDGEGHYPPEADVTLTIGSPCDSTEILSIPVYMENPCPVGGFSMQIVLTDMSQGVYFDVNNPNVVDTIGSRNSGWGFFNFNVNSSSTVSVSAVGPGGQQPVLPPGEGLIFTVHPSTTGSIDDCQLVRFGALDHVIDSTGYSEYGRQHNPGTLCVGCESSWGRGDANRSGTLNIADVVALFSHLQGVVRLCFGGCICTGDFNHNGVINVADVIQMFAFLQGLADPPDPCD